MIMSTITCHELLRRGKERSSRTTTGPARANRGWDAPLRRAGGERGSGGLGQEAWRYFTNKNGTNGWTRIRSRPFEMSSRKQAIRGQEYRNRNTRRRVWGKWCGGCCLPKPSSHVRTLTEACGLGQEARRSFT